MKLGKLLGAGKSVFGGEAPAAYRANKHAYLPKFNDGKNPFATKAPEPAAPVAPVAAPAKMVAAAAIAPVMAPPPAKPAASVFTAPVAPSLPVPKPAATSPAISAAKPARGPHWAEKLNQLWSASKPATPAAPSGPMPNVQPDLLSLDAVKVLHNDLSDADVEVVPMKSRTVQARTAPMPAVAMDFTAEPALKSA
jgi:hypothetical protein